MLTKCINKCLSSQENVAYCNSITVCLRILCQKVRVQALTTTTTIKKFEIIIILFNGWSTWLVRSDFQNCFPARPVAFRCRITKVTQVSSTKQFAVFCNYFSRWGLQMVCSRSQRLNLPFSRDKGTPRKSRWQRPGRYLRQLCCYFRFLRGGSFTWCCASWLNFNVRT